MAVLMSVVMLTLTLVPALSAAAADRIDYEIVNPYAAVDWEQWDTYKACLHTHTTASDADVDLQPWLNLYYDQGYDILALTDHGVINHGWNKKKTTNGIFNGFRPVSPISDEEYERLTTGSDRGGKGMTDITGAIECNMAVISQTHVNGYWTDYGQGVWGTENDYETAPREIERLGGYSVLNHVGDWVNSNNFPKRSHEPFYINYFANIFTKYHTCLGMEIVNGSDNLTRADRELWDELLQVVIPTGRNIWGFSNDDSHSPNEIGNAFELFPLAENTEENVREAMVSGAFFAASRNQKTPNRQNEIIGDGLVPMVTSIRVDGSKITVECDPERGCEVIEWVSNGRIISTDESGSCSYTIDLNDYKEEIGCYVRFVLKSVEHGVTYSQPFELRYDGRAEKEIPASPVPDNTLGKSFWTVYQNLITAFIAFVVEKIARAAGVIPVIPA